MSRLTYTGGEKVSFRLFVLFFSSMLSASSAFGDFDSDDFRNVFLEKIPTHKNFSFLFNSRSQQIEQLVTSNEELKFESEIGLEFLKFYRDRIDSDFSPSEAEWILNPEAAAIRFINFVKYTKPANLDRSLTDQEAHRLAWTETQRKFQLPHNMQFSDVELRKKTNSTYFAAIKEYRRRVFALQVFKFPLGGPEKVSIETLKLIVKAKIEYLRRKNFLTTAKRSLENHEPKFTISRTLPDGKKEKFESTFSNWLGDVKVRFLSPDMPIDTQIVSLHRSDLDSKFGLLKKIKDWIANELVNFRSRSDLIANAHMYKSQIKYPLGAGRTVELTTPTGQIYRISEKDWEQCFANLWIPDADDLQAEPRDERRYIAEGNIRDVNLANLDMFLSEQVDRDASTLIQRLQDRLHKAKDLSKKNNQSITDQIRASTEDVLKPTAINGLRWKGFLTHPNFWRYRELLAEKLKRPELKSDETNGVTTVANNETLTKQQKKEINNEIYKEAQRSDYRDLTKKQRAQKSLKYYAVLLTGAAAILVPTYQYGSDSLEFVGKVFQNVSNYFDSIELPDSEAKNGKVKTGQSKAQSKKDIRIGTGNIGVGNFDLNGMAKNSQIFMKIEMQPGNQRPEYVNLFSADNLTTGTRSKTLKFPSDVSHYDMKVRTLDVFQGDDLNRIPIAHFDGYKLVKLELISNQAVLQENVDFQVVQLEGSQLMYANMFKQSKGSMFRYNAYYEKGKTPSRVAGIDLQFLDQNVLKSVGRDLSNEGFKQLGDAIFELGQKPKVTLSMLEQVVKSTGFYTYETTKEVFNLQFDLHSYKIFLKNGVLYYQCSGSNGLMIKVWELYKINSSPEAETKKYFAAPYGGYVINSDYVTTDTPHLRTVIFNYKSPAVSQVIDATPLTMDPNNGPKAEGVPPKVQFPDLPGNLPPYNWNQQQYAIISEKWSYQRKAQEKHPFKRPIEPFVSTRTHSLNPPINYAELSRLEADAKAAYASTVQENSWFNKDINNVNAIGLGVLPASQILLRWSRGELKPEEVLYELIAQRTRISRLKAEFDSKVREEMNQRYEESGSNLMLAIGKIISETANNSLSSVNHANKLADENYDRPEIEIGSGGLGVAAYELALYLSQLEWVTSANNRACEELLYYANDLQKRSN